MSRRQDIQSAEGIALRYPRYGVLDYISKTAPVGGEIGFAPGAVWRIPTATGSPNSKLRYLNIGSNGIGTNSAALWVIDEPTSAGQGQFGQAGGSTGFFLGGGVLYRTALTTANGISPSATTLAKIVDAYTLPANVFDIAGRVLQFTVFGTFGATANAKQIQVIFGATNTGFTQGAGIAGQTDGTITVTGGTVIVDSTSLVTNTGGLVLTGQLMKTGAAGSNTQESMTTGIAAGAAHAGCGTWTNRTFTEANAFLIVVAVTLATATTDFVYQGCIIQAYN